MLSNLVYVSTRTPECTDDEINKILKSCEKNNSTIDITGVLLYSDKNFIQYIEGEYKEIIALYDKIKSDSRHKNAKLITSSPIQVRTFPSWQMGSKKFDTSTVEFKTQVDDSERKTFTEILDGKNPDANKAVSLIKKFFK